MRKNNTEDIEELVSSAKKESHGALVWACVALGINLLRIFVDALITFGIL